MFQAFFLVFPQPARIVILLLASGLTFGQSGPTLVGAGYSFPASLIAPGQVITLEIAGLKTVLSPPVQKASSLPLPTVIAGISVSVNQSISQSIMGTPVQTTYKASILSLNQFNLCPTIGAPSDCLMTFITVQIPYELSTAIISPPIIKTQIVITENGTDSKAFLVAAVSDHIHVATTCDGQPWQTGCPSVVAHADGSLVTAQAAAKPGEVVVIYGWGLGKTAPVVKTGDANPIPAAVVTLPGYSNGPFVGFDFSPNAAPSRYFPERSSANAYLTPGFVGLYQINVQLPSTFPAVLPCGQEVQSNLTINIGGPLSFDGAAICVQPPE